MEPKIQTFTNTGHGFEPSETISTPRNNGFLALPAEKDRFFHAASNYVYVFQRTDGRYQNVEQINTDSHIARIQFLNGLLVTAHGNGRLRFYQTSDYHLERTLIAGSSGINGFSETEDGSLLAAGGIDMHVRVFQFDGSTYSQVQQIYAGFRVRVVKLSRERLIFTGQTNKVWIYESNGTQYLPSQCIQTNESIIYDMSISQGMSRFVFGGDSNTLSIYELANGIYELRHQQPIATEVLEVIVDPDELYLMV